MRQNPNPKRTTRLRINFFPCQVVTLIAGRPIEKPEGSTSNVDNDGQNPTGTGRFFGIQLLHSNSVKGLNVYVRASVAPLSAAFYLLRAFNPFSVSVRRLPLSLIFYKASEY